MSRRTVVGEVKEHYSAHGYLFVLSCGHRQRGYYRWVDGVCQRPKTMKCTQCSVTA